ncbi:hypothetical protein Nepgr_003520 [Nepenthes gracilis]|uniref:Uncharacterized protein n=1 Tax=Nepenthes gracilis TaxID=150966 RepID=A0AAD3XE15_NEPGR|nr:hypothetical protein Nepgr_003520 [Nepenthes gracilis]
MALPHIFSATVLSKNVVTAATKPSVERLPFSNLDLLFPENMTLSAYFCYEKHSSISTNEKTVTDVLKESLAQILNSYHVFAGEVVSNSMGEPELLCNNQGVDFSHAYADLELQELDHSYPDITVQGKLVPTIKRAVLSVQVTEMRCGGHVLGCTFNHQVADAYSANMFFLSWAECAKSIASMSYTPVFQRSLLNPRKPGHHDSCADNWYHPVQPLNGHKNKEKSQKGRYRRRTFYVEAQVINRLQAMATSGDEYRTKYESLVAYLWKFLAESVGDNNNTFKISIAVDGRTRLYEEGDPKASMMHNYFGNVVSTPYSEASVGELKAMPLTKVADTIHKLKVDATTPEHFFSVIDWVQEKRPKKVIPKFLLGKSKEGTVVLVSSGMRFPVSMIDFGWGKPIFGSYYFPCGDEIGYVMPMPSVRREGDWVVFMHLQGNQMAAIERDAAHVFRPLHPSYINGLMINSHDHAQC